MAKKSVKEPNIFVMGDQLVYGYDLSHANIFDIMKSYSIKGKVWKIYLSDKKIQTWIKSKGSRSSK